MDLIADTSALVGELLRERGRALLTHPELTWFATEEIASEVHHEARRRIAALAARRGLAVATSAEFGARTLHLFDTAVRIIPRATYMPLLASAEARIGDPDDRATVALALATGVGIRTLDRDFFAIGLPVRDTDVLIGHIAIE
jgi:predicted nucleic acid-binding protein